MTSTKMVVKWLIICSVLTLFILEGTNASSMWLKDFMGDMKRSREEIARGQRGFERQTARFGSDYARDRKQHERQQKANERQQKEYERERAKERAAYALDRLNYANDRLKYANERENYELNSLRRELFDKGPENCKLTDNFKNKNLYGKPYNNNAQLFGPQSNIKIKENTEYKTYKCKDEPRYKETFFKLVTMIDMYADDGSFSITDQKFVKYIGEDKEDFDWEPDMSKYERKEETRSHSTDRKSKGHRHRKRSDNEENKKPRKKKRKETEKENSRGFFHNLNINYNNDVQW